MLPWLLLFKHPFEWRGYRVVFEVGPPKPWRPTRYWRILRCAKNCPQPHPVKLPFVGCFAWFLSNVMFIWQGSDFTDILPREFVRQSSISWWGSVQYVIILSSNQAPPYSNKNSISSYRIEASVQKLTKCYFESSNLPFFAKHSSTRKPWISQRRSLLCWLSSACVNWVMREEVSFSWINSL